MKNEKIKAIIFDFDGTLIDTMNEFADLASKLISKNYDIGAKDAKNLYLKTSGNPFSKQLEILFPNNQKNIFVSDNFEEEKIKLTKNIQIDKKNIDTLKILKSKKYFLIISSSNFRENIENSLKNYVKIFDDIFCYDKVLKEGKPHFNEIQKKFNLTPEGMLFVGDSIKDSEWAQEHNVQFIAKLGTFLKSDFSKFKTIESIDGLLNIL